MGFVVWLLELWTALLAFGLALAFVTRGFVNRKSDQTFPAGPLVLGLLALGLGTVLLYDIFN